MLYQEDDPSKSLKRKREILPFSTPPPVEPSTLPPSSEQQRPVRRANRACNTCRRQKMRCDGPESYPCSRCKNAGIECIFENPPPNRDQNLTTARRMETLGKTMEAMQAAQLQMHASIQEILHELRRPPVNSTHRVTSFEDCLATETFAPSPFTTLGTLGAPLAANQQGGPLTSPRLFDHPSLPPIQSLLPSARTPVSSTLLRTTISQDRGNNVCPSSEPSRLLSSDKSSPGPPRRPEMSVHDISKESPCPDVDQRAYIVQSEHPPMFSTARTAAFQDKSREKKISSAQINTALEASDHLVSTKRPRLDARQILRDDPGNRAWNPDDYIRDFRVEDGACLDAIDKGLLTELEAQIMFTLFFEHCHPRMPIFDPKTDNVHSLRRRSPFCFCCVLMVAVKARDGGNQPSAMQLSLWNEAMSRAKDSMFHRVKDLEVIQGLLLLSAWSESTGGTSWILAGHAIRCGVEMGIHKSLAKLASETKLDESATHILVCSARVWCALFAFEHQLSLGIGRFTMTGNSKTVKSARETLLRNPLSNPHDMRLVSACEIMILEYQILESLPNADAEDMRCQTILKDGRARLDAWHAEWHTLLDPFFLREHYMHQMIDIHRCYAHMTIHLACMPRNVAAADVAELSEWERENCFHAVSAARDIVNISVEKQSYRDGLQYSPPCFSGGVSFVGALILRLGSVLSGEQDAGPAWTLSLAEKLSQVLQNVPTCRFKFSFMTLLEEHRKNAQQISIHSSSKEDSFPKHPTTDGGPGSSALNHA